MTPLFVSLANSGLTLRPFLRFFLLLVPLFLSVYMLFSFLCSFFLCLSSAFFNYVLVVVSSFSYSLDFVFLFAYHLCLCLLSLIIIMIITIIIIIIIIIMMIMIIIDVLGRRVLRSPRDSGGWDFTSQSSKHL